MKKLLVLTAFCGLATVTCGALIGLFSTSYVMTSDPRYGEVPVHRCVVERGWNCGMYNDPIHGFVEVAVGATTTRQQLYVRSDGAFDYKTVSIEPTRLSEREIQRAFASRTDLRDDAAFENAAIGAMVGLSIWGALASILALLMSLRFLHRNHAAIASRFATFSRDIKQSAETKTSGIAARAALRAEVREAELRARKAVAEAIARRENPDAFHHDLTIRKS